MAHRAARIALSVSLLVLIYAGAWVSCGCGPKHLNLFLEPESEAPNTNAVISTIGKFGMCHACPISADLALTSAHCVDLKPFDAGVPVYGGRYSNGDGTVTGEVNPLAVSSREDLAVVELVPPGGFYTLAADEPKLGETVYWSGYDYRSKKNALKPRLFSGDVVYVAAGNLVIGTKAEEGSSGGCILNGRGEVVGILDWGMGIGVDDEVAIAVGVWGSWADEVIKRAKEHQAKVKAEEELAEILRYLEGER